MVDITKEEFWDSRYEDVSKKEKKNSKVKEFIINHKIITMLLISFTVLTIFNTILIYNFLKILITIN